jgi:hypothetical protein
MHRFGVRCLLLAALVTGALGATSALAVAAKSATPAPSSRSRYAYHQFTGIVTALDKQSLTVEKHGKQPSSRTFSRHEAMSTTGDLVKDSRVTVYYRDEGGKSVAHKVVVKAGPETAAN